jgi:hypothetical protein
MTWPVARKRSWPVVTVPACATVREGESRFCHLCRLVTVATRSSRAGDLVSGSQARNETVLATSRLHAVLIDRCGQGCPPMILLLDRRCMGEIRCRYCRSRSTS